MLRKTIVTFIAFIVIAGCTTQPQSSLPEVIIADTPTPFPSSTPTVTPEIELTPTLTETIIPTSVPLDEAIQITKPQQAESIGNPVTITGVIDTSIEQTVYVRLVDLDSIELGSTNTVVQKSSSELTPFELILEYTPAENVDALLQVYFIDSNTGTLSHLNSRMVKLEPPDPPKKNSRSLDEMMQIDEFRIIQNNNKLELQAEGSAGNLFENTLEFYLCGTGGTGAVDLVCGSVDNIIVTGSTVVKTSDVGGRGPFQIRSTLPNGQWKTARLVIFARSAANGEITHAASISIKNGP